MLPKRLRRRRLAPLIRRLLNGAVPKTDMPYGTIGKLKISRMILGSNLMGGYSHSRDLAYVGPLMQAYNTEEKIMETLALAEAEGINTISQGDSI